MTEKNMPRMLLRDCMLWADRDSKLGQIGDITVPVPQEKVEELRNAGMPIPIEVKLGYEKMEFSFKMPGLDPQVMKLFGLAPGKQTPFMITGAFFDEDTTEHSAVLAIEGFLKKPDAGTWKPGDMAENDYLVSVRYYKFELDGEPIFEVTPFDVKIGGQSQYEGIRRALLLD